MNMIEEKLKEIIIKCGSVCEKDNINENTNLINDLGFESVNLVELIVDIETEFNIDIDDEYLELSILSRYSELLKMITELSKKKMA